MFRVNPIRGTASATAVAVGAGNILFFSGKFPKQTAQHYHHTTIWGLIDTRLHTLVGVCVFRARSCCEGNLYTVPDSRNDWLSIRECKKKKRSTKHVFDSCVTYLYYFFRSPCLLGELIDAILVDTAFDDYPCAHELS